MPVTNREIVADFKRLMAEDYSFRCGLQPFAEVNCPPCMQHATSLLRGLLDRLRPEGRDVEPEARAADVATPGDER